MTIQFRFRIYYPSIFIRLDTKEMNRGQGYSANGRCGSRGHRGSWGRGGPRGRYPDFGEYVYREKIKNPALVEKSVEDERKSEEYEIGSIETQSAEFVGSGDNKDLLQSHEWSSRSKHISLSGGSLASGVCGEKGVNDGTNMPCDFPKKMNNVSLPCPESVFSKVGQKNQKGERFRVEDHNSLRKSSDAVHSSNEKNIRPFDIFLEKKVIQLKPSLFDQNREQKNASKGYHGIVIRPGMVLLKNYLSINDQVMVLNKCRRLGLGEGGFYRPGYKDGALLRLNMMCLGKNWDPETSKYGEIRPSDGAFPPKIPVEFDQLVENAIKESQCLVATNSYKGKGEDEIPFMKPDICIVNFYTTTGRLGLHQDKDESEKSIRKGLPVVSFSIGDSAEFLYGDHRDVDRVESIILESGDVLLFGGKSRKVFHGVTSIYPDTAPKALLRETSLRPGRLNLTFRQY